MGAQKEVDGFSNTVDKPLKKDGDDGIRLKRQLTLFHGVAIIVGIIVGSGIFVSPVGILLNVRSVGLSFIVWIVCGLYNTLCAICYAELGTCLPQSGGEYIYIKRALGDYPAFVCLWINFLLICPVGIAAMGLIFAEYILKPLFPDCEIPNVPLRFIAALIMCLLVAVNCRNVKWATKVQVVFTISKMAALVMIIIIGLYYIGKGEVDNFKNSFEGSDYSAGAIALAFYSGFWAYSGWSYLNFLIDELIEPHKNLPRAIAISMIIVITVYLVANVAYLGVLTPNQMMQSTAVAVTFGDYTMGVMAWIVPILIAISVAGTMNGCSLSMSRLFFVGAKNGHFPTFISMIHLKYLTPMPSLIIICILVLCYQTSDDIFFLIEMEGFGFVTILTMVLAGQVVLRYTEPDLPRPIKLPIVLPAILSLISFAIVILTFVQKPTESFMALGLVGLGTVFYIVGCRWTGKPKEFSDVVFKWTAFFQKLLYVVEPENPEDIKFE